MRADPHRAPGRTPARRPADEPDPPMADADDPTPARRRLPDTAFPPLAGGGPPVPLREPRHATVLVLLGEAPDEPALAYLRQLEEAAAALAGWDGRVLVVARATAGGGAEREPPHTRLAALRLPFPVLADPAGTLAAAAGVAAPALVVADQWGEVHAAEPADEGRGWPTPAAVEQWLRFLAIRCAG
jgi:hypothetical protein